DFQFSPDGAYLVDCSQSLVQVWDWRRQTSVSQVPIAGIVPPIAFDDGSRRIAVGIDRNHVAVHEIGGGPPLHLLQVANVHAVAFHPDGNRLAVRTPDAVEIHDLAIGRVLNRFSTPYPDGPRELSWHPGGRLLGGCASNDVCIWDSLTGTTY